jgi:hypothetical protein
MRLDAAQETIRDGLLAQDAPALESIFGRSAPRFAVHRRHFVHSLTRALENTFPAVVNLVDARFFAYAADAFIRADPPRNPRLFEYGGALPDFLERFSPCKSLPYLGDVARLEWAMHCAFHAEDESAPGAVFRASVLHVASRWPVYAIWRVAMGRDEGPVDLAAGPAHLIVWREDEDVYTESIEPAEFALHTALSGCRDAQAAARLLRAHVSTSAATALRRRLDAHPQLLGRPLPPWRSP